MRNFNTDFSGNCCESELGLPEPCITEREFVQELQKKADLVNVLDKTFIIQALAVINARLTDIELRLTDLETP
jgi:hypothetical protein